MEKVLVLSVGGMLGTLARYFIGVTAHRYMGTGFPYGTLAVNALGCFLIGFLGSALENRMSVSPQLRLLLMVGFCGAFTTFSAYIHESHGLLQGGEMLKAGMNIFVSVFAGLVLFKLGMGLGKFVQ